MQWCLNIIWPIWKVSGGCRRASEHSCFSQLARRWEALPLSPQDLLTLLISSTKLKEHLSRTPPASLSDTSHWQPFSGKWNVKNQAGAVFGKEGRRRDKRFSPSINLKTYSARCLNGAGHFILHGNRMEGRWRGCKRRHGKSRSERKSSIKKKDGSVPNLSPIFQSISTKKKGFFQFPPSFPPVSESPGIQAKHSPSGMQKTNWFLTPNGKQAASSSSKTEAAANGFHIC